MNNKKDVKFNKGVATNVTAICVSILLIVLSFCGRYFSGALRSFCNFFLGAFGMSFFGIAIAVIVACSFRLSGKKITVPVKYAINFVAMYLVITLLVHTASTRFVVNLPNLTYQQYVAYCFDYYSVPTFGGVVFGSIAYGLEQALHVAGSIIVLCLALGVTVIFAGSFAYDVATNNIKLYKKVEKTQHIQPVMPVIETQPVQQQDTVDEAQTEKNRAMDILFGEEQTTSHIEVSPQFDTVVQSKLNNDQPAVTVTDFSNKTAETILFGTDEQLQSPSEFKTNSFFTERDQTVSKPLQSNATEPAKPVYDDTWLNDTFTSTPQTEQEQSQPTPTATDILFQPVDQVDVVDEFEPVEYNQEEDLPFDPVESFVEEVVEQYQPTYQQDDFIDDTEYAEVLQPLVFDEPVVEPIEEPVYVEPIVEETPVVQPVAEQKVDVEPVIEPTPTPVVEEKPQYTVKTIQTPISGGFQQGFDIVETKQLEEQENKVHQYAEYNQPPLDLLNDEVLFVDTQADLREELAQRIVNKLAVHGILVEPAEHIVGPTVTRYQFRVLSEKTRMGDFAKYTDDLKACLESQYDLVLHAPVPGTSLIGIEVPNKERTPVMLRPILESDEFKNKKGDLVFAIGKEITGKNVVADLASMPHMLVAGASGSGKSIALHNIIVSLMYRYSPEYLRFILVDPKYVEMSKYDGSPHLLMDQVLTTVPDTVSALDYLISEMESRYQLIANKKVSKISEYNAKIDPKYTQKLPYIVLVVEELADFMVQAKTQVEAKLCRLAGKARAAGICMILATQRPSVDVVTGLIKANITCRMALSAASQDDSRTMLGGGGAEKLLGKGDMLFVDNASPVANRIQGAYLSNDEIASMINYIKDANESYYPEDARNAIFAKPVEEEEQPSGKKADAPKENGLDSYCKRCMRFWLEKNHGKASASSIQRSQNIGFNRAGKILDQLTDLGYIEAPLASESNTKPRKVLINIDQLDELFPDMEG